MLCGFDCNQADFPEMESVWKVPMIQVSNLFIKIRVENKTKISMTNYV